VNSVRTFLSSLETQDENGADVVRYDDVQSADFLSTPLKAFTGNAIRTGQRGAGTQVHVVLLSNVPLEKAIFVNDSENNVTTFKGANLNAVPANRRQLNKKKEQKIYSTNQHYVEGYFLY